MLFDTYELAFCVFVFPSMVFVSRKCCYVYLYLSMGSIGYEKY